METDTTNIPADTYVPSTRPGLGDHVRGGHQSSMPGETGAAISPATASGMAVDFTWGADEESELLELRAALMTDEALTSQRVAELASQLPGIGACLILSATGEALGGNFPPTIDRRGFEQMVPRIYANMRELGDELGVGNAETFTVHTDKGMLSFFMGDNRCLSVLHTSRRVVPGVRERLILVARELSKLNA